MLHGSFPESRTNFAAHIAKSAAALLTMMHESQFAVASKGNADGWGPRVEGKRPETDHDVRGEGLSPKTEKATQIMTVINLAAGGWIHCQ